MTVNNVEIEHADLNDDVFLFRAVKNNEVDDGFLLAGAFRAYKKEGRLLSVWKGSNKEVELKKYAKRYGEEQIRNYGRNLYSVVAVTVGEVRVLGLPIFLDKKDNNHILIDFSIFDNTKDAKKNRIEVIDTLLAHASKRGHLYKPR